MKDKLIIILGAVFGVVILIVLLLLLGGSKKTTCKLVSNQTKNGYSLETQYEIYSKNNIVNKVVIHETITSDSKDKLEKFEKDFNEQYETLKTNYGGYTYKVTNKNNKITTEVTINYGKFNMEKFIKNNEAMKQYTKKNKLTLEGAKDLYERSGAECK